MITIAIGAATPTQLLRECLTQLTTQGQILMTIKTDLAAVKADAEAAKVAAQAADAKAAEILTDVAANHTLLQQLQAKIADLLANPVLDPTLAPLVAEIAGLVQSGRASAEATLAKNTASDAALEQDVTDNQP